MGLVVPPILIVALAHYAWQRRAARDIVDRWLMENRFRARELRVPWFSVGNFPMTFFRSQKSAVVFRGVVEDRSFGGTGIVWFRVWPGLAGKMGEEIEVSWEKMPHRVEEDPAPLEEGWWARQLDLPRRLQRGETTFRLRGHDPQQGREFDELVEAIVSGNTYANVHSAKFLGGEARGVIDTDERHGKH